MIKVQLLIFCVKNIGKSTVYDIFKQKDKILKFVVDSDSPANLKKKKTLRRENNVDLDKVLIQWIRQKSSENVPLTGPLIIEQAKLFYEMMEISTPCA